MKIDLDELERRTRDTIRMGVAELHVPDMLALITRIRELEGSLVACIDTLHYGGYDTDDARMIRDRGVVVR